MCLDSRHVTLRCRFRFLNRLDSSTSQPRPVFPNETALLLYDLQTYRGKTTSLVLRPEHRLAVLPLGDLRTPVCGRDEPTLSPNHAIDSRPDGKASHIGRRCATRVPPAYRCCLPDTSSRMMSHGVVFSVFMDVEGYRVCMLDGNLEQSLLDGNIRKMYESGLHFLYASVVMPKMI